MRIAFSGSHRVGKSTLVEAVAERLPGYATVEEQVLARVRELEGRRAD